MIATAVRPIRIHAKQAEFRRSLSFIRGFCAGRGCGKTRIGAQDILLRARAGEPFMAVSPSFPVLSDTTWPAFREIAEEMQVWIKGRMNPVPTATFRTQDGGRAQIVFRSGDDPESLRGPSKAGLWLDEASLMHVDCFKLGIAVLRHKGKMGFCTMTFTPKGKRHWTYRTFYDEDGDGKAVPRENTHLVRASTLENPFLPPEYYENIRSNYSSALAAQELGGDFVELEGLMFSREFFTKNFIKSRDMIPKGAVRVRYWDLAGTAEGGAHTCGVLMARDADGIYYVEDVVRGQWSMDDRNQHILETAEADAHRYNNEVLIVVEQEPGSGGKEQATMMMRRLARFPVQRDVVGRQKAWRKIGADKLPGEAKIIRAQPFAAQCEHKNVKLVRAKWTEAWLEEIAAFPEYAFADQVDASSGAFNKLTIQFDPQYETPKHAEIEVPDAQDRYGVQMEKKTVRSGDSRYMATRFQRPGYFEKR